MPVEIPLTRGYVAIIDKDELDKLSQYKWRVFITGRSKYAITTITTDNGRKTLYMHRLILLDKPGSKDLVDHVNGNGLDNRKINLRRASVAQNGWNRNVPICTNKSGTTGVQWREQRGVWRAEIFIDGKRRSLGHFGDKADAVAARKNAELKYYGEFAPLR